MVGDAEARLLAVGGFLVSFVIMLFIGSRLVKAAFLGENQSPLITKGHGSADSEPTLHRVSASAAIAQVARRLYTREPQIKALYLQQTVFLLGPVILLLLHSRDLPNLLQRIAPLLAMMLPLSHAALLWSLFGLDGRGLMTMLLSGISHREIIKARLFNLLKLMAMADVFIVVVFLAVAGAVSGNVREAVLLAPLLLMAVITLTAIIGGLGAVMSVMVPMRLASSGRRPIQTSKSEAMGLRPTLVRLLLLMPVLFVSIVVASLVTWPFQEVIHGKGREMLPKISPWWGMLTIPCAVSLVWAWLNGCLDFAAKRMFRRESLMLEALADTGD
jgi:hypothetical protein